MANLGSDDTPIVGESFGLPSGWSITENAAGEVVIEDSGANVVFRRDETAGEWVTDSINAGSIKTETSVTKQQADVAVTSSGDGVTLNTGDKIPFGAPQLEQLDGWDADEMEFTAPTDGTYVLSFNIDFDGSYTGIFEYTPFINDSALLTRRASTVDPEDGKQAIFPAHAIELEEGDVLDIRVDSSDEEHDIETTDTAITIRRV